MTQGKFKEFVKLFRDKQKDITFMMWGQQQMLHKTDGQRDFLPPENRALGIGTGSTCGWPQTKVRPNWNHAAFTNVSDFRPLDGFHLGNKIWRISDCKCYSYDEIPTKIQLFTVKLKPSILSTKYPFRDLSLSGHRLWILLFPVTWHCVNC